MNKLSFLLLAFILCLVSCGDDEQISDARILAAGQWSGTFSEDDSGTWTMSIASNGTLTGELLSTNVPDIAFLGTGTVTKDGQIMASIMVSTSTSEMIGTINETSSSGNWSNSASGIGGTWEGSKN